MNEETCHECGAKIAGGQAACQALFQTFGAQAFDNLRLASVHRLAVDSYCLQHVDPYCVSAKSYAAHLVGLCCGVAHNGNPALYDIIHRWLNGSVTLNKPDVLGFRGRITLPEVLAIQPVEAQVKRVHDWAASVWDAYATQHEIAQVWVKQAFEGKESNHRKGH